MPSAASASVPPTDASLDTPARSSTEAAVVERVPESAREVLISVNPKAGARSGRPLVEELAEWLRGHGYQVRECQGIDDVRESATESFNRGDLRAVVAAGGDGTVSLVANETPLGVPIAVLPLGTENLLAKYAGITRNVAEIGRTIDEGRIVRLDAGTANGRLFLLMAGIGFDADVVQRLHAIRTGHIRHWTYIKPILDAVRSYEYPPLNVYCDTPAEGEEGIIADAGNDEIAASDDSECVQRQIESRWVFVVNLPRYAGGLRFAPDAVGHDGVLDVCTFRQGSMANGLRYLLGVAFGWHVAWPDCQIVRAARVRITSEADVPYQLDGDPAGNLPLEICVSKSRLTLLVGDNWTRLHNPPPR